MRKKDLELIRSDWPQALLPGRKRLIAWKGVNQTESQIFRGAIGAPYILNNVTIPLGTANWLLSPLGAIKEGYGQFILAAVLRVDDTGMRQDFVLDSDSPAFSLAAFSRDELPYNMVQASKLLDKVDINAVEIDAFELEMRQKLVIPKALHLPTFDRNSPKALAKISLQFLAACLGRLKKFTQLPQELRLITGAFQGLVQAAGKQSRSAGIKRARKMITQALREAELHRVSAELLFDAGEEAFEKVVDLQDTLRERFKQSVTKRTEDDFLPEETEEATGVEDRYELSDDPTLEFELAAVEAELQERAKLQDELWHGLMGREDIIDKVTNLAYGSEKLIRAITKGQGSEKVSQMTYNLAGLVADLIIAFNSVNPRLASSLTEELKWQQLQLLALLE